MNNIEMTGKTISEAVEAGAKALDLSLGDIEYKVLDEGSKGFLGLGARPARVLVWKTGTQAEPEGKNEVKAEKKAEKQAEKLEKQAEKLEKKAEKLEKKAEKKLERQSEKRSEPKAEVKPEPRSEEKADAEEKAAAAAEAESIRASLTDADRAKIVKSATDFLESVFEKMGIKVELDSGFVDNKQIMINMSGEDMGILIGKRGQTLDSLQYLTNLVVNKGEYPYMNVTLDTEGYRVRRKETLERLAFNLAKKAKHNHRNVSLEPMNPYERRIIHATLQNDRYVTTFSEGAEPYRYVVIALKNGYSGKRRYNSGYSRREKTDRQERTDRSEE